MIAPELITQRPEVNRYASLSQAAPGDADLVAGAIFGVLLWLRLDYWTNEYLELDDSLERYLVLIYITMAAGAVLTALSIFGLIGGCCKLKWMLVIYLTSVVVAMCLTISSVVYGSIYRDELERTLVKNDLLQDVIQKKYFEDERNQITRAVDIMQSELECCGGEGPLDYDAAVWRAEKSPQVEVPASCCKNYLQHNDRSRTCFMYLPTLDRVKSDAIWQNGCKESLQDFLDRYIVVVISIAVVYFVLQLICMIVASILIHLLNTLYVPQPDDIVYDMAHNQEKSPYPSRGDYRDYYH
ncbi:tetraspanin [Plakobranchus ocellatus]|uniref:Tetraspanin n=1 Tax=Plakobranchus ocellatus TaxID=259542 RepID=A0AAV4BH10_9GAST|nr:tetraspanin [Plakobranchus ocellatus]